MGVMTSGTVSNTVASTDGVFFGATGEGNTLADYRAYAPERTGSYVSPPVDAIDQHANYLAGGRNATEALYVSSFPGQTPPAAQEALFPGIQTGAVQNGSFGMTWRQVEIEVKNQIVSWRVDGVLLITINTAAFTVPVGGGNISFGHADINATSSTDPLASTLLFTLVDNVRVQQLPASWSNAVGGSYQTASNWLNSYAPLSNTPITFDLPNTYTTSFSANAASGAVSVTKGNVTLNLATRTYNVGGSLAVSAATLNVQSGHLTQSVSPSSQSIAVGNAGTLNIAAGAVVDSSDGNATIGTSAGATAAVSVTGAGSQWKNVRNVTLGRAGGNSTLSVKNQATMQVNRALTVLPGNIVDVGVDPTPTNNGFLNIGEPAAAAPGTVRVGAGGTLTSGSAINGHLVNDAGTVRPGNSPGILTINGNFSQSAAGTLEIEVGGLAAGTQHDKVVVTPPGSASVNGTLSVPVINGFTPTIGDEVTFLTATNITGGFSSIAATGLPPGIAVRVRTGTEGDLQSRFIRFVDPLQEIELNATPGNESLTLAWNDVGSWKNVVSPGSPRVPDEADIINVSNTSSVEQIVEVTGTEDAFTYKLALDNNDQPIKVAVTDGLSLSAVAGATIGEQATIELDNGTLVSGSVQVTAGGTLTGNGVVKAGEVVIGASMGAESARFEPGKDGVGSTEIQGDYTQGAGGELAIEVASGTQFDTINLQGNGDFGGRLVVQVTDDAMVQPGSTIQVVTATTLTPESEFDVVRTEGSTDTVFVPVFNIAPPADAEPGLSLVPSVSTLTLVGKPQGDLDLDGVFNAAADAAALAQAFTNPSGYKSQHHGTAGAIMGNINNDDFFDFDDIRAFRVLSGMPASELAAIFRNAGLVPEPSGLVLALVGLSAASGRRLRR
jgi:T5SS/PEP-CTERM-associated repeat protein